MKTGYVYIISNPAYPGFLKFGITDNINKRLSTYQTSCPHRNYKVEYYIKHINYKQIEKELEKSMKYFVKQRKNEWVEISLDMAISLLNDYKIN